MADGNLFVILETLENEVPEPEEEASDHDTFVFDIPGTGDYRRQPLKVLVDVTRRRVSIVENGDHSPAPRRLNS